MAINQYFRYPGLGVTSINNLVGAVTLAAGSNITLTPVGNTITIAATGGGGSGFDTIGTFDTGLASGDGLNASGTTLFAQSASASNPGMVNTGTQTLAGAKTFSSALTLSSLTASRAVVTDGSKVLVSSATTAAEIAFVNGVTSAIQTQLNSKQATLTIGDLTAAGTDGIVVTAGTGAVIGSGTSLAQHVADSTHNGYLLSTDWVAFNAKQAAGNYITALTGDGTAAGPGSVALTLATVNSNVGSFGSSTSIPSITVNAKGLITAASTNVVIAPAGTLTGTTLNSTVVTSSLTSVGTITSGTWNGTTIAIANGGTGQTSANAAFNALSPLTTKGDVLGFSTVNSRLAVGADGTVLTADSTQTLGFKWGPAFTNPMTTGGDTIYGGASGVPTRLANGTAKQFLQSNGTTLAPTWASFVAPTVQVFTSSSGTYTTPAGCTLIRVRMIGGGGGGGSNGTSGTVAGGTGGNTTFAGNTAAGGSGGAASSAAVIQPGATGNANTFATGTQILNIAGAAGNVASTGGASPTANGASGSGANGVFGGGGKSVSGSTNGVAGTAPGAGGGGGGGTSSVFGGPGGASGGFLEFIISSPSATYSYAVGAAGTAGTGAQNGGAGFAGIIIVDEFYN